MSDAFWFNLPFLVTSFGTLLISAINYYRLGVVHKQINSRMDQLLTVTAKDSKAEGILQGTAEGIVKGAVISSASKKEANE